jgi:hypothetical protein
VEVGEPFPPFVLREDGAYEFPDNRRGAFRIEHVHGDEVQIEDINTGLFWWLSPATDQELYGRQIQRGHRIFRVRRPGKAQRTAQQLEAMIREQLEGLAIDELTGQG